MGNGQWLFRASQVAMLDRCGRDMGVPCIGVVWYREGKPSPLDTGSLASQTA